MWEKKKEEFLSEIMAIGGSLTEVQSNALGQFLGDDLKEGLKTLVPVPGLNAKVTEVEIPLPPPPAKATLAQVTSEQKTSEEEAVGLLDGLKNSNRTNNATGIEQQAVMGRRKGSIDFTVPTVDGVAQEWTVLGNVQAPCVWDNHHRHMHKFGNCTLAHTAKKHCPPGAEPHVDFVIQDGDKTIIECYQNVQGKTDNHYSALCECHSTVQNCFGHNVDLLPELLDPSLVDMAHFFDFDVEDFSTT